MNVQCHRKLCELGRSEIRRILSFVKLIFGKYFCYFDANCVTDLIQLHLQLDAIHVLVHERVKTLKFPVDSFFIFFFPLMCFSSYCLGFDER